MNNEEQPIKARRKMRRALLLIRNIQRVFFILGLNFPIFIPLALMIEMSAKWKTAVTGMMAVAR